MTIGLAEESAIKMATWHKTSSKYNRNIPERNSRPEPPVPEPCGGYETLTEYFRDAMPPVRKLPAMTPTITETLNAGGIMNSNSEGEEEEINVGDMERDYIHEFVEKEKSQIEKVRKYGWDDCLLWKIATTTKVILIIFFVLYSSHHQILSTTDLLETVEVDNAPISLEVKPRVDLILALLEPLQKLIV